MAYTQSQVASRTVYLTLVGDPAISIEYTDLVVKIKKANQNTLTTKTLVPTDWVNLGEGLYTIKFSASETNIPGEFVFTLTGTGFDNFVLDQFTIQPGNAVITPAQCVVTGSVFNQSALPPQNLKIVARPVQFPAKVGQNILAADAVYTYPDSQGNFTLVLVRNSVVMIEIERCGIKAQVTVPDAESANLLDLLPEFAVDYSDS